MNAGAIASIFVGLIIGYIAYHVYSRWGEYKELYKILYKEKEAQTRRYLKEKQGFDKI